jgi:hypothetical protein
LMRVKGIGPAIAVTGLLLSAAPALAETYFDDPLFRRCYEWMTEGKRGAMIDNLCLERYTMPSPALFLCAQKIVEGFSSATDQKGCEYVFEEYAKKAKSGFVR